MVYGLGNKGIRLLEVEDGIRSRKLDWTARNRGVTRFFLEHTLAVADAMTSLEVSCRLRGVEFVQQRTEAGDPLKWSVPVPSGNAVSSVGVVPDRVFALNTQTGIRWFFLEADRATMPVERNSLKQTSFSRKLLAYHETWRQRALKLQTASSQPQAATFCSRSFVLVSVTRMSRTNGWPSSTVGR